MIPDDELKKLGEMLEQGIEEQLKGNYESPDFLHQRLKNSKDRQTVDWNKVEPGRSAGSSRPFRTGAGDRRKDDSEQE